MNQSLVLAIAAKASLRGNPPLQIQRALAFEADLKRHNVNFDVKQDIDGSRIMVDFVIKPKGGRPGDHWLHVIFMRSLWRRRLANKRITTTRTVYYHTGQITGKGRKINQREFTAWMPQFIPAQT